MGSREGYVQPYVEKNQGPPHQPKNDDSDERSFVAIPKVSLQDVYKIHVSTKKAQSCLLARERDNGGDERLKRAVSYLIYFHISRLAPIIRTEIETYTKNFGVKTSQCSRGPWVPECERYKRLGLMGVPTVPTDVQPCGKP